MVAMIDSAELFREFEEFYTLVRPAATPYQWQLRLLDFVAREGVWPEAIAAPTGAGKTCVLYVHTFLNALAGQGRVDPRLPRRLALTVGRRALVDSQAIEAQELRKALDDADPASPLGRVREGLRQRAILADPASSATESADSPDWLSLAVLRGGAQDDREGGRRAWRLQPLSCAILCMTPDMFGSRILFRGYGSNMLSRPVDAGLLAYDTVLVVDEAHLSRQLVMTARCLPALESRAQEGIGMRPLQIVSTTATPSEGTLETVIDVTEEDCAVDAELHRRLLTPKPVTVIDIEHSLADKRGTAVALAEALRLRERAAEGTVGCIVNTVDAAVKLASVARGRKWRPLSDPCGQWTETRHYCDTRRCSDARRMRTTPKRPHRPTSRWTSSSPHRRWRSVSMPISRRCSPSSRPHRP